MLQPRSGNRIAAIAATLLVVLAAYARPASSNVITDWDEKAVGWVPANHFGERAMALIHLAMFDAVNSIDRRYRPYLPQLPESSSASMDAAAASAAAAVIIGLPGQDPAPVKAALTAYLARLPNNPAKTEGIALGEAIAAKVLAARAEDGAYAADTYRPLTRPGVYVATANTMVGAMWPEMKPFALTKGSQFRPGPPPALRSKEWAKAYNEVKEIGGKASTKRSAQQTEVARFWLMVGPIAYHPFARQVVQAKNFNVVDSAHFMAVFSAALTDAYIAIYDAKYHYNFWRPLTSIRNGDTDDNSATERDAAWQPIETGSLHPEFPSGHGGQVGAAAGAIEAMLGSDDIAEVAITSPTAPGVTHRFTSLKAFVDEVGNARIWAGFHYRFSCDVAVDMGRKVGRTVATTFLPLAASR